MDVRPPVAAAGLLVLMALPAVAAPFVAGAPRPLSMRIAASRAAVLVRHEVDARPTSWIVESVLFDVTQSVSRGQRLEPRPAPPAEAHWALLISNPDRTVESLPLSEDAVAYVRTLPRPEALGEERFAFALAHIAAPNPLIAEDAFAELVRFSTADFVRYRNRLPRRQLASLVERNETPGDRVGLYGYLLGLCGTPDDAAAIRRRLFAAEGLATGADGLATGYLMLTDEAGLADLEAHILLTPHTSPILVGAVLDALAFLRSERCGPFNGDRLRHAACCALSRSDAADLAVGHLAAAKEWTALPEVVGLLEAADANADRRRAGQVSAVRFLLECYRDADAPSEHRAAASRLLDDIAAHDSDLIRRATHLSGVPRERH